MRISRAEGKYIQGFFQNQRVQNHYFQKTIFSIFHCVFFCSYPIDIGRPGHHSLRGKRQHGDMEKHPEIGRSLSIQKDTFGTEIVIEQYQLLPLIVLRGTFRGGHTGSALCRPRSEDTKRSLRHYFLGDELSRSRSSSDHLPACHYIICWNSMGIIMRLRRMKLKPLMRSCTFYFQKIILNRKKNK